VECALTFHHFAAANGLELARNQFGAEKVACQSAFHPKAASANKGSIGNKCVGTPIKLAVKTKT
jgi:hypothetical protein